VSGAADLKAIVAAHHAVSAVRTATAGRRMASAVLKRAAPKVAPVLKTGALLKAGRAPTAVVPKAVRGPRVVRVAKVVGRKAGPAQRVVVQKLVARKAVVRKVVDQTGAAAKAVPVPMVGLVLMGVLTPKAAVRVVLAFLRDHSAGPDRADFQAAPAVDLLAAHRTVKAAAIAWN